MALHLQHLHFRPRHLSAERHRLPRPVSGDPGVRPGAEVPEEEASRDVEAHKEPIGGLQGDSGD